MKLFRVSLLLGAVCLIVAAAPVRVSERDRQRASDLARQAMDLMDQHRLPQAEAKLREALGIIPDKSTWLYNLACIHSLSGKADEALDDLDRAADAGFTDFTQLQQDPMLAPLRKLPRFLSLLERKDEIRHHAAERALGELKSQFGEKYLYDSDEEHKLVFAASTDQATLDELKQQLLDQEKSLQEQIFSHPRDEFIRVVVPAAKDFPKLVTQHGVAGMYLDEIRTLVAQRMGQVMVHEFTHAVHAADQRAVGEAHPVWLREGLASMYEAGTFDNGKLLPADNYRLSFVQSAARRQALVPLDKLLRYTPQEFTRNANLAYGESSSLLLYLHEKDLLRRFYDTYKAGYSLDFSGKLALEKTTGLELPELQKAWSEWMLTRSVPTSRPVPGGASLGVRFSSENDGLKINLVLPNGPGAMSGLKIGDVIVGMDERDVRDYQTLLSMMNTRKPGDLVVLKIRRGESYLKVPVALGKR